MTHPDILELRLTIHIFVQSGVGCSLQAAGQKSARCRVSDGSYSLIIAGKYFNQDYQIKNRRIINGSQDVSAPSNNFLTRRESG